MGQGDVQEHAHLTHHQKEPDPQCHRKDQHQIGHGGQLLRQHLQVRLRNGDYNAEDQAGEQGKNQPLGTADLYADAVTHGDHGHIHAQGEEPHADDQQGGPEEKQHHGARCQRCNGDGNGQHDGRNGAGGSEGFPYLFQ